MECKFSSTDVVFGNPLELIDTLWNVNRVMFYEKFPMSRINRYIMECKCDIK